ncbi:unnamed protein product [Blepharisma stoltei]|uniref:Kelch repeat-containing protein n=1 Tax=Blepharisma stoltei TaxID=1481888 RepID=A0AAU9ING4_9CILI|nr:unnamed protein product [Blepharisma stoltei]
MERSQIRKKKGSDVVPFRLVTYTPSIETQLLVTSRKEFRIRVPTSPVHSARPHIENSSYSSNLSGKISPTNELLVDFKSNISDQGKVLSPTFDENINRLQGLHWMRSLNSRLSLPSASSQKSVSITKILQDQLRGDSVVPKSNIHSLLLPQNTEKKAQNNNKNVSKVSNESPKEKKRKETTLVHWSLKATMGSKPNSSEGSTLVVINRKIYIFGARLNRTDLNELDMITGVWRRVNSNYTPNGRLGCSLVVYKRKMISFGGYTGHSQNLGIRRCSSKIYVLSMDTMNWQRYHGGGSSPSPRRNHSCTILGKCMLVYGGVDQYSHPLADLYLFDIKNKEWSLPDVKVHGDPGPRSHCTFTAVFNETLKSNFDILLFNVPKLKQELNILNSGFYLFGGLDMDGHAINALHGLYVREGQLVWSEVEYFGKPPSPRYSHSACSMSEKLFIYGGRNDQLFKETGDSCLGDLYIFNVEHLLWENVQVHGNIPEARWSHCMCTYGTRILVFGGMTHKKFMNADLYSLETNSDYVEELIKYDKEKYVPPSVETYASIGRGFKSFLQKFMDQKTEKPKEENE